MTPYVSVVVPVRNGAPFAGRCIASLRAQTLRDVEFLIVDDASTDGTPELLLREIAGDDRFKVLRQTSPAGPLSARMRGVAAATSPVVMFMDFDDELLPDACQIVAATMSREKTDVFCYGMEAVGSESADGMALRKCQAYLARRSPRQGRTSKRASCVELLMLDKGVSASASDKAVRTEVLRRVYALIGNGDGLLCAQDYLQTTVLSLVAESVYVDQNQILYRYHYGDGMFGRSGGMSWELLERRLTARDTYRKLCEIIPHVGGIGNAVREKIEFKFLRSVRNSSLKAIWSLPEDRLADGLDAVFAKWGALALPSAAFDAECVAGRLGTFRRARMLSPKRDIVKKTVDFRSVVPDGEKGLEDPSKLESRCAFWAAWIRENQVDAVCFNADELRSCYRDALAVCLAGARAVVRKMDPAEGVEGLSDALDVLADTEPKESAVALLVKGFHMGGMQSILGDVARALQRAGHRVVFLTSRGEEDDFYATPEGCARIVVGDWKDKKIRPARRKNIACALRENRVNVLFIHLYDTPVLEDDIAVAQECGAKAIVHFHSAATSLFARGQRTVGDVGRMFDAYRAADALICLSRCDEAFFRMMGVRARYIPNPLSTPPKGFRRKDGTGRSLIWIGRLSKQEKRPQDAVAIFEEVLRTMPNATLTILGDGSYGDELRRKIAGNVALSRSVRMPGKVHDVWGELANADVLLLTSAYEGFANVVAEAYAAGVPVVGYAFENLELCKMQGAYRAAPHGDIKAVAREIEALFSDNEEWGRAHAAALDAYAHFASFDYSAAYGELVADVLAGKNVAASPQDVVPIDVVLRTFFVHACIGRLKYLDALDRLSSRPNSIRGCLRFILRRIRSRLWGGMALLLNLLGIICPW